MADESYIEDAVKAGIEAFKKGNMDDPIDEPLDIANETGDIAAEETSDEPQDEATASEETTEEVVDGEALFKKCNGGVSLDEASPDVLINTINDGLTALGL